MSNGILELNKTAGVNSITGPGVQDKVTPDILVSGGTLLWNADNQVADTAFINMTSGAVNLNGHAETLFDLANSGGTFTTGAGAVLVVNDPTWSGTATNTISSSSTATFTTLNIIGGTSTNTVQSGATLNVGGSGLHFSGTSGSANLTINSDATTPGTVVLNGNVVSGVTGPATASISSGGSATHPGTLDLNGSTRAFTVTGNPLTVSASIIGVGAGINVSGGGTLVLAGANTYTGQTNVTQGKVVVSGSIGGTVNVSPGATLASGANFTSQVAAIVSNGTVSPGDSGGTTDLSTVGEFSATSVNLASGRKPFTPVEIGGNQDGLDANHSPEINGTLQYDRISMSGALTLNSTLDVSKVNSSQGFNYAPPSGNGTTLNEDGHVYFLITGATSVTGTFTPTPPALMGRCKPLGRLPHASSRTLGWPGIRRQLQRQLLEWPVFDSAWQRRGDHGHSRAEFALDACGQLRTGRRSPALPPPPEGKRTSETTITTGRDRLQASRPVSVFWPSEGCRKSLRVEISHG